MALTWDLRKTVHPLEGAGLHFSFVADQVQFMSGLCPAVLSVPQLEQLSSNVCLYSSSLCVFLIWLEIEGYSTRHCPPVVPVVALHQGLIHQRIVWLLQPLNQRCLAGLVGDQGRRRRHNARRVRSVTV